MGRSQRPFNPDALRTYARQAIRAELGPETLVRRYTVFVPLEEIKVGLAPRRIATDNDLARLQLMLIRHFGGVTASTITPSLVGAGARDPRKPKTTQEINKHAFFVVYAAAVRASDEYFHALRKELAEALVEGVILVEAPGRHNPLNQRREQTWQPQSLSNPSAASSSPPRKRCSTRPATSWPCRCSTANWACCRAACR